MLRARRGRGGPRLSQPPERARRGDLVAAAVLVVVLVVTAVVYGVNSPAARTRSTTADTPGVAPAAPATVPAAFAEAWRAPNGAEPVPVTAGPGVVTADGGAVVGRDALTGAERWRYARDLPLCTVGTGFGRALALYRNGDFCSELTSLDPDLGQRRAQSNPDSRAGARFLPVGNQVALVDPRFVEAMRSDLVTTLQYGAVVAPAEPGRQPRTGCTYRSFAAAASRLGVVEHCPGEVTDRLTVLRPESTTDATTPHVESSTLLASSDARLVALSAERAMLLLPAANELEVLDAGGAEVGRFALGPAAPAGPGGAAAPAGPDGAAAGVVPSEAGDAARLYWWSGSGTVALERSSLTPEWQLTGTLGAGVAYAGRWLVPVTTGIAVVDPDTGAVERTVPVDRDGYAGPVTLAAHGSVLLEQRGTELVALVPAG